MFRKFWNTVGATCRICLMSRRLSFSAVVMALRWSKVVPMASRLSATKGRRSLTAPSRPCIAWPHSLGVLVSTVVTLARFLLNEASRSLLEVQRGYQQLQVAHRAEDVGAVVAERRNRLGQLDDGVARGVTLAAQVVCGGVDEFAQRACPALSGGLQGVGQLLQLPAQVVPLDGHRGPFLGNGRAVSQFRTTGVDRDELDRPRGDQ